MKLINLTPHVITVIIETGVITFPSAGIARVSENVTPATTINVGGNTIQLVSKSFGTVEGLPDKQDDTLFVVSTVVKSAASSRDDLIVPHDFVRNNAGIIIGCKAFSI